MKRLIRDMLISFLLLRANREAASPPLHCAHKVPHLNELKERCVSPAGTLSSSPSLSLPFSLSHNHLLLFLRSSTLCRFPIASLTRDKLSKCFKLAKCPALHVFLFLSHAVVLLWRCLLWGRSCEVFFSRTRALSSKPALKNMDPFSLELWLSAAIRCFVH